MKSKLSNMTQPNDYFQRSEVSNSDLTALKEILHPRPYLRDREKAFRFGTLVDALITEPQRVNHYQRTVDHTTYTPEEFSHGLQLLQALRQEAAKDHFLAKVLQSANTQTIMTQQQQPFLYDSFHFTLNTRCKWDWWLPTAHFGGDLKTTTATTQRQFEEAIEHFDWDRSRAWYMDIAQANQDFIYAISKKTGQVFKKFITRDDPTYTRGRDKYQQLAFQYFCFMPQLPQ